MKKPLDSATIEIPCPNCSQKTSETIGKLKTKTRLTCGRCRASFDVDATDLRRKIAQAEDQLSQLSRTLSRLGK